MLPTLCRQDLYGLMSHFFGGDGRRQLSAQAFKAFICDLRAELLRLEFQHYDWQHKVGSGEGLGRGGGCAVVLLRYCVGIGSLVLCCVLGRCWIGPSVRRSLLPAGVYTLPCRPPGCRPLPACLLCLPAPHCLPGLPRPPARRAPSRASTLLTPWWPARG